MNVQSFVATTRARVAATALAAAGTLLSMALSAPAAWEHAHGDSANTGLARVDTARAVTPQRSVALGEIALGANPVIGPDGTVYIGNLEGELMAFHPDGTLYWKRQLNNLHGSIFAAPVVGADGSVYVVSCKKTIYNDHRDGADTHRVVLEAYLHKFNASGAWLFATPFPVQFGTNPTTTAPPNIWRWNGTEAIMVPTIYRTFNGTDLRLIAFSTQGLVLADQTVTSVGIGAVTGGSGNEAVDACMSTIVLFPLCMMLYFTSEFHGLPLTFEELYHAVRALIPGVGIRPDPEGGAPFVVLSDGRQDKVAYAFSPQTGFSQVFRSSHLRLELTTPPVVLPNGDTVVGATDSSYDDWLTFTGPHFVQLPAINVEHASFTAPTRLADGRLAVIGFRGYLQVLKGSVLVADHHLDGDSIASAAASCTHLFVSTTHEFVTFDAKTMAEVAHVPVSGGGLSAPVIGPHGHVYVIVSDHLLVFPPPLISHGTVGRTACDNIVSGTAGGAGTFGGGLAR